MKVLIAYATKHGSTVGVAEKIGEVMKSRGAEAEVANITDKPDPAGYDAVVVGGAVYIMMLNGKTKRFVAKHKKILSKVSVAYFVVCGLLKEDTTENREKTEKTLKSMKKKVTPVDVGLFAGKYENEDYRDWDAITAWAEGLVEKLKR